jgi:hypothetical protein
LSKKIDEAVKKMPVYEASLDPESIFELEMGCLDQK